MSEHFEHNPEDHEDPIPASTWLVGAIGAVLLIVIIFGLTALYYNAQMREDEAKVVRRAPFELQRYRERQVRYFVEEPTWATRVVEDEERSVLVIPIEQAMEEVIREFGGRDGNQTGGAR